MLLLLLFFKEIIECISKIKMFYFSVDGLSNNFKAHPLQLDHPSDTSGTLDGTDFIKTTPSLHESKKSSSGTPHGACLTLTDHDRIRQFIQEFTFRGLLPHIEKTIRQLNDQVKSLFQNTTFAALLYIY